MTKKYEASGVRFQWASPKNMLGLSRSGTLDFQDGIVSVGTNDAGDVITFVCPRVTVSRNYQLGFSTSFSGEVEIGKAGGKIDPITGKGTIYLDDVNWKFWGAIELPTFRGKQKFGISEQDAATFPVLPRVSGDPYLVLDSIAPGAYAGQDPAKIFSSYLVKASQGMAPNQPLVQRAMLGVINTFIYPGLLEQGTSLQWNIDLKSPVEVNGI